MLPVRRCDFYHPHAGMAAEAIDTGHLKHAGGMRGVMIAKWGNRLNLKRRKFGRDRAGAFGVIESASCFMFVGICEGECSAQWYPKLAEGQVGEAVQCD